MNLLRRLGIREGSAVLEIGFGHADDLLTLSELAGLGGTVYGVERSRRRVKKALKRIQGIRNIRVLHCDAYRIPLPDGHVDHVILKGVLHEVNDVARALREARRLLRRGGSLSIVDFDAFPRTWLAKSNMRWRLLRPWRAFASPLDRHAGFSKGEIKAHLASSGFRLEHYQAAFAQGHFSGHDVALFLAVARRA